MEQIPEGLISTQLLPLIGFKCYEDHECSHTYVHAAMVGGVMLCDVGSMFFMDYYLGQLFVSSNFSVLTRYVYSCYISLTVMPCQCTYVYRFPCCNVCTL